MLRKDKLGMPAICCVILFGISILWSGAYYEYSSAVIGAIAMLMFFASYRKTSGKITLENGLIISLCFSVFYLISCLYATDPGMAFMGVAKKGAVVIFALLVSMLAEEQRCWLLHKLPEFAVLSTAVGALGAVLPFSRSYVIAAGRFCGTFGYANTYALFLVLAIFVLLEDVEKRSLWQRYTMGGTFLLALWFTGSRYTWMLMGILLIVYAIKNKENRKTVLLVILLLGVATVAAATIFSQSEAMGRLFSTNLSTLWGRMLYWQDAWKLIQKHFFGMGYLGYYYEQTGVQTGVYSVRYVHNDILQWIMDIGWLPVVLILFLLGYALYNKRRTFEQKFLLVAILLHSCMEFDWEHNAIVMLVILILSCTKEGPFFGKQKGEEKFALPSWVAKTVIGILGCICLYMSVPLCLYAGERMEAAVAWYPPYTDARMALLSMETDPMKADKMADDILSQNTTITLAYDAKAQVAFQNMDFEKMIRYKKTAIASDRYNPDEYLDYLSFLNEILVYSQEQGDQQWYKRSIAEMKSLLILIKENEATVSALGKRIDDPVNIALGEELENQIANLE